MNIGHCIGIIIGMYSSLKFLEILPSELEDTELPKPLPASESGPEKDTICELEVSNHSYTLIQSTQ